MEVRPSTHQGRSGALIGLLPMTEHMETDMVNCITKGPSQFWIGEIQMRCVIVSLVENRSTLGQQHLKLLFSFASQRLWAKIIQFTIP